MGSILPYPGIVAVFAQSDRYLLTRFLSRSINHEEHEAHEEGADLAPPGQRVSSEQAQHVSGFHFVNGVFFVVQMTGVLRR
jgi:hypothetical protein